MRHLARTLAIGAVATAVAATVGFVAFNADAADGVQLSNQRPATASSLETAEFAASNAFDDRGDTRWASLEGVDPQWLAVDLGSTSTITRVQLRWEAAYAKAYQIQVSDDQQTWRSIYSTAKGDGGTDNLTKLSGRGRYLRMYGTRRGTQWGYSLWEMKVFGRAGGSAGPTTAPSSAGPSSVAPTGAGPTGGPTGTPTGAVPSSVKPTGTGSNPTATPTSGSLDLSEPHRKDIAMQLVSSAENSSLDWKAQYQYIEDIGDGRGYTGGIVGFCSGTGDMLEVVEGYTKLSPNNGLAKYLPALRQVNGSASHSGLDGYPAAWKAAASDQLFRQAQDAERDSVYFNPAVQQAKSDGLRALGQFIYYDALVMHGPGSDAVSFGGIRATAMRKARTPAQGGDEKTYLSAFLDARKAAMLTEAAHDDTSRVDTAQRVFLDNGNFDLFTPLSWKVYGESYTIGK